jgi:hypothetical protein
MRQLIEHLKVYFRFSRQELGSLTIASFLLILMLGLRKWNQATLGDLIAAIFIVVISLLFHISVQKIVSVKIGYSAEFKLWWYGLLLAFGLSFAFNDMLWFLAVPGGLIFSLIPKLRLGKFRYGLNVWQMAVIAFSGPIASIALGSFFKMLNLWFFSSSPIAFFDTFFYFNLAYAVCSILPIPPLDGHYVLFASKLNYVFIATSIIAYGILVALNIYSWIFAILFGILIWFLYYTKFEAKED